MTEIQKLATSDKSEESPQGGDNDTIDYNKLLTEGYVYDNEDLVTSRPNSAYFETGQLSLHMLLHSFNARFAIVCYYNYYYLCALHYLYQIINLHVHEL